MKNLKRLPLTFLFSIFLILVIALCFSGTVVCQSNTSREAQEMYYDELESDYLSELKLLLETQGYTNCGITMTRVILENGERNYSVTIHHKLISRLTQGDKEKLMKDCGEVAFADKECTFSHNFL